MFEEFTTMKIDLFIFIYVMYCICKVKQSFNYGFHTLNLYTKDLLRATLTRNFIHVIKFHEVNSD